MRVLTVCAGNVFRSVIAERVFRDVFGGEVEVWSAGILKKFDGRKVRNIIGQTAVDALERCGMGVPNHVCRTLTERDLRRADYVFVMESWMRSFLVEKYPCFDRKIFLLRRFAGYRANLDIFDSATASFGYTVKTILQIERAVKRIRRLRLLEKPTHQD